MACQSDHAVSIQRAAPGRPRETAATPSEAKRHAVSDCGNNGRSGAFTLLSLIHISEPTRLALI
eukprot:336205-Alexandrium_andersonii.AAC.1